MDEHNGDGAPADLAVPAKSPDVNSGGGESVAMPEGDKSGSPRPRWWRALVPGSIVLLILALIFLIKIVGLHRDWWSL